MFCNYFFCFKLALHICNAKIKHVLNKMSCVTIVVFCRLTELTLKEVLDMIDLKQIKDKNTEIVIEPPEVHYLTDEDSAEEDNANLNHLSGNQLRAPALINSLSAEDNFTGNPLNEVLSIHLLQLKSLELSKKKR